MQYREEIHNYIQSNKEDIVNTLKELIRIPSVRGEAEENAPFGKECARALEFTNDLYKSNGFETELDRNGGYLLSYYGEGEKSLGIFAHADVVPVSDDWIYTKPFEPIEKDGCIIGRGALDNKAAVVISLYCAKILKELNIPFNSRLIMFTGSSEESGMADLENYLTAHTPPQFSIVPDTAFPLYRGNKGRVRFSAKSKERFSEGISINGGTGATVIGSATVNLPYSEELFSELSNVSEERITVKKTDEGLTVGAVGIAKHSAIPEGSLSAVAVISEVMSNCKALDEKDRRLFTYLYKMANCHYGEFFCIENNDEEFGKLTCVLAKTETAENGEITVHFNIRHGADTNKEFIIENIRSKLKEIDFTAPLDVEFSIPNALLKDNEYVQKLLDTYKEFTGNRGAVAYINAGGTYRQFLKDAVEIGPTLKWGKIDGMPIGHGGAHQPDECTNIDGLLNAIELTALMLLECD